MQAKGDRRERRAIALAERNHMMIEAAGPEIGDALVARHEIEPPDRSIELLRSADIRSLEIDAAQCRDWKMGHCRRLLPTSGKRFALSRTMRLRAGRSLGR